MRSGEVRGARLRVLPIAIVLLVTVVIGGHAPSLAAAGGGRTTVGVVIDSGSENDDGFNEYSLKGARKAARSAGYRFIYRTATVATEYERHIEDLIQDGANLVVTVGFRMGNATARSARRHRDVRFAIVDTSFSPGAGCSEDVDDCYTEKGGLANVTSITFAEDQLGYLAGVLAGCMTQSGTVASVGGEPLPPVVRFITGYDRGVHRSRSDATVLSTFLPTFDDPNAGKVAALDFIGQGADVVFAAAGGSGVGSLEAAAETGKMAIGVDVDQYHSVPAARPALLTSASKKIDVATAEAVSQYAKGKLKPGIRLSTTANGRIELAPYHDWKTRIPQSCKDQVDAAKQDLAANPGIASE